MRRPHVSLVDFDPDAHQLLLASWLKRAYVRRFWGEPSQNLHEAVKPDPDLSQALIQVSGAPVGYLRWAPLSDEERRAMRLAFVGGRIIDVDVLIGSPEARNQGVASEALRRLATRLTASETVAGLIVCPSVENLAAIRAFEKAGFRKLKQYQDPEWGLEWVMCLDAGGPRRIRMLPSRVLTASSRPRRRRRSSSQSGEDS